MPDVGAGLVIRWEMDLEEMVEGLGVMSTELIMLIWIGIAVVDLLVGLHLLYGRAFQGWLTDAEDALAFFLTIACGLVLGGTLILWGYTTVKYRPYSQE